MTMYEKLIQLRKDHDLTQEALAEQLAISRQAIIKWYSWPASTRSLWRT